jgi:hypothetical protein
LPAVGCSLIAGLGNFKDAPTGAGGAAGDAGPDAGPDTGPDASPCGDTQADPENCGACGHVCGDMITCASGLCEPTLMADHQMNPTSIAADGVFVFWTNSGDSAMSYGEAGVQSVPRDAPLASPKLLGATADAQGVALSSKAPGYVFWSFQLGGLLAQSPKTTSDVHGVGYASASRAAVSPDQETVFWTTFSRPLEAAPTNGAVRSWSIPLPTDGGFDESKTTPVVTGLTFPQALTVTSQHVCYVERGTPPSYNGGVDCVSQDAGAPTGLPVYLGPVHGYGAVVADETDVYWTSMAQSAIYRATGADAGAVLFSTPSPMEIALDAQYIYWTADPGLTADAGDAGPGDHQGEVWRADRKTGAMLRLAAGQNHPLGIAVDDTYVFWVNRGTPTAVVDAGPVSYVEGDPPPFDLGDGQVMRVHK